MNRFITSWMIIIFLPDIFERVVFIKLFHLEIDSILPLRIPVRFVDLNGVIIITWYLETILIFRSSSEKPYEFIKQLRRNDSHGETPDEPSMPIIVRYDVERF